MQKSKHSLMNRKNRVRKLLVTALVVACVGGATANAASVVQGDQQVVASRGGVSVTLADIDAKVMELPPELRAGYLDDPQRIEETISSLLLAKQLAAKAYELGAGDDPYLPNQLEQARTRYMATRARVLNEQLLQIPDFSELAHESYLANPAKYSTEETLQLTHILVSTKDRDDASARARAEEAHKLAVSGERSFGELVAEYTDEEVRGAKTDGRLQNVTRGIMVPEFEHAAFALSEPGQISDVVKTDYGYHVILLNEKKASERASFEQIKPKIIEELRKNYISAQKANLPDQLRSMKVEASPDLVASLRTRYTADGPKAPPVAQAGSASTGTAASGN